MKVVGEDALKELINKIKASQITTKNYQELLSDPYHALINIQSAYVVLKIINKLDNNIYEVAIGDDDIDVMTAIYGKDHFVIRPINSVMAFVIFPIGITLVNFRDGLTTDGGLQGNWLVDDPTKHLYLQPII